MKLLIKSSFILAIILGFVLSQNTQPAASTQTSTQTPQSTTPATQGTPQSTNPPPQGVMRNGAPPTGPNNMPPQQPGITDKLANITDSRLVALKNILQYLPPIEQDLIAGNFRFFGRI